MAVRIELTEEEKVEVSDAMDELTLLSLPALFDILSPYDPDILKTRAPPRPPNTYVLFRSWMSKLGNRQTMISHLIWREVKTRPSTIETIVPHFDRLASEAKQVHARAFPDYKYRPVRRGTVEGADVPGHKGHKKRTNRKGATIDFNGGSVDRNGAQAPDAARGFDERGGSRVRPQAAVRSSTSGSAGASGVRDFRFRHLGTRELSDGHSTSTGGSQPQVYSNSRSYPQSHNPLTSHNHTHSHFYSQPQPHAHSSHLSHENLSPSSSSGTPSPSHSRARSVSSSSDDEMFHGYQRHQLEQRERQRQLETHNPPSPHQPVMSSHVVPAGMHVDRDSVHRRDVHVPNSNSSSTRTIPPVRQRQSYEYTDSESDE